MLNNDKRIFVFVFPIYIFLLTVHLVAPKTSS